MIPAKKCYSHIGGKLGTLLMGAFVAKGWIAKDKNTKHYHVTTKGIQGLRRLGLDLKQIENE